MRVARNILCIISVIAPIFLIIIDVFAPILDQRGQFIATWVFALLIILSLPFFAGTLSLAVNKEKIPIKYWFATYFTVLTIFIIVAIQLGGINITKDMPNAISRTYETISGYPITEEIDRTTQTIKMGEIEFTIDREVFDIVINEQQYTIIYLENSKYVIDLLGFDGKSLLKQRNR